MQNPANRELMAQLYRWFEKYEQPKKIKDLDKQADFFRGAWLDLDEIIQNVKSPWVSRLAIGFYEALEDAYKEAQKGETENDTTA